MLRENGPQRKENFSLKIVKSSNMFSSPFTPENTEILLCCLIQGLCFSSHPPLFHWLVLALMEIYLSIFETYEQIAFFSAGHLRGRLETKRT